MARPSPAVFALALVVLAVSLPGTSRAQIDRQTAMNIFFNQFLPANPDPTNTAAFMFKLADPMDSTLHPGDILADADSNFTLQIVNPTYLFWVDAGINEFWNHPSAFFLVDATNGIPVAVSSTSWPVINNNAFHEHHENGHLHPDFIWGGTYPIAYYAPAFTPVARPNKPAWGLVIAGVNMNRGATDMKDEPAIRGDAERGLEYLNKLENGPKLPMSNITVVGLDTPGETGATKKAICDSIDALPKNCEKLYVMYFGHGQESGPNGAGMMVKGLTSRKAIMKYPEFGKKLLETKAKEVCILIMDCYSGNAKSLASVGINDGGKHRRLKGVLVTSSNDKKPTFRQEDGSAFMKAFIRCTKAGGDINGDGTPTMPEIVAWAITENDSAAAKCPTGTVLGGKKTIVFNPGKCKTKTSLAAGGTVSYWDSTANMKVTKPARLIYELKSVGYRIFRAAKKDSLNTKNWLYIRNPYPNHKNGPGNVKPPKKAIVKIYQRGKKDPCQTFEVWPWLEANKRHCITRVCDDAYKFTVEPGPAASDTCKPVRQIPNSPGLISLAEALVNDTLVGDHVDHFNAGEYIFIDEYAEGTPGDMYTTELSGPNGWGLFAESDSAFIPASADSDLVITRGDMPDTASQGDFISLDIINHDTGDTTTSEYHALLYDSLEVALTGSETFIHQSLDTELGVNVAAGTLTLNNSVLNLLDDTAVTVGAAGTLDAPFSVIHADSGITVPVTLAGALSAEVFGVSGAADGLILDGASGSLFACSSVRSHGAGLTLTGDLSGLSMESFNIVGSAGRGMVADGVSSFVIQGAYIGDSGGDDVHALNGASLTLRNTVFDDGKMTVEGGSEVTRTWSTWFSTLADNGDSLGSVPFWVVDALGDTVVTDTTDSEGLTVGYDLVEWVNSGGASTAHTPHTLHASFAGVDTSFSFSAEEVRGFVLRFEQISSVAAVDPEVPATTLKLSQNIPNPLTRSTLIRFETLRQGPVRLRVFDVQGRYVATLIDKRLEAGGHEAEWQAPSDLAAGVYYYRLETPSGTATRRMVLLH